MAIVLIGIDDTDNQDSPGTGKLARRLDGEAAQRGAVPLGITRHQFLQDARIPFTTHNSGACIAIEWAKPVADLKFAMDLIQEWAAEGSDPGVCIALADAVPPAVSDWGWRATREVLTMDEARAVAKANGMWLRDLGGTGQGIIGALGSVGLRADGNHGRYLDLPGLRDVGEFVSREELSLMGIQIEHQEPMHVGAANTSRTSAAGTAGAYKTMGWIRPRLTNGKPVWVVEWSEEQHAWIPVDRKRSRPLE